MQINPDITLDDVIGLDDAKAILKERFVDYPKFKNQLRYSPSKGCLLYGYPGTGKTLLAKAMINSIGLTNPLFYFKELRSSDITAGLGSTEKKVEKYFEDLIKEAPGKTPVLVMDEVEQIIPKKNSKAVGGVIMERISAILRELDGLNDRNNDLYIIATTNHPDKIEDAFLRSGRIDKHIEVRLPDEVERWFLIEKYIGWIPGCEDNRIWDTISKNTNTWAGADFDNLAKTLELKQKLQGIPLDAITITKAVEEVDKYRKKNFMTYKKGYEIYKKKYR